MQKLLVKDGLVINRVKLPDSWTGAPEQWQPPAGVTVLDAGDGDIGDEYDGAKFIKYVFINRDPQTNEIRRITKTRNGPAQTKIRANHADVIAFKLKQDEIGAEDELILKKREARARRLAIIELEAEGVVLRHN